MTTTVSATIETEPLSMRRIHALRFGYLVLGGGLALYKWPLLFRHEHPWPLTSSVVTCMLVALSLLALLGLRYPVRMLPILLFEVTWKLIWLGVVVLPLWLNHDLDAATRELTSEVLWVVIIMAVIPWRFALTNFLARRAERWR
jgi:hypothetical protein